MHRVADEVPVDVPVGRESPAIKRVRSGSPGRLRPPLVALVASGSGAVPPVYGRELTASLLRLGCHVVVLTGMPTAFSRWVDGLCAEMRRPRSSVAVFPVDAGEMLPVAHGWQRAALPLMVLQGWSLVRDSVREAERRLGREVSCVFFSSLDEHLRGQVVPGLAGRILDRPWAGVYVGTRHITEPATGRLRPGGGRGDRPAGFRVGDRSLRDRRCLGIGVLDARAVAPLHEFTGRSVTEFPDLTDEELPKYPGSLVRDILHRAGGRPIIGMPATSRGRGVLPFLRTAVGAAAAEDWYFCCAGPIDRAAFTPTENAWIDGLARDAAEGRIGNLHFDPDAAPIPDGPALNSLLSAFSVVVLGGDDAPEDGHLLTKAALLRRPVVAARGRETGRRVEAFGLGATATFDDETAGGPLEAIRRVLEGRGTDGTPLAPRWEAYHSHHSRRRLDESLGTLLGSLPI